MTLSALGLMVAAAALAQERAEFAAVEKVSGEVGFYSAAGKHMGSVKVGTHPHEAVLSADRKHLYVTDNGILWMTEAGEGGNTISIIDVAARTKAGVIDLGKHRRPHGLDLNPQNGQLVVTTENPDGLLLVDPKARKVVRSFSTKGEDPHMVLFGPAYDRAFVSNVASGTLGIVNLRTGEVQLTPVGKRPQGAVRSRDGKLLYLTNSESASISVLDIPSGKVVREIATGKHPARVDVTPDNKTLVYNLTESQGVGFADIATGKEMATVNVGGRPMSLMLSRDGRRAYTGIQDQDKVVVVSVADRKVERVISTRKGGGPDTVVPLD